MSTRRSFPFHPFLFALSPLVHLYTRNASQIVFSQTLPWMIGMLLLASLVFLVARSLASGDLDRAALVTLSFLFFFMAYGLVRSGIQMFTTKWVFPTTDRRLLLPICCLLVFLYSYYFLTTQRNLDPANRFLNATSAALIVMSLVNLLMNEVPSSGLRSGEAEDAKTAGKFDVVEHIDSMPDIYYIVLDGYGRADALEKWYNFDNSSFLREMEALGFRIASESRANYSQTDLSLSSSLNFDYIPSLLDTVDPNSKDRREFHRLIAENRVAGILEDIGYQFISFETGSVATTILDADLFVGSSSHWLESSSYSSAILHMTPLSALIHKGRVTAYDIHRQRLVDTFADLASLPDMGRPRFVFAHVIAPHPPFVFGPSGEPLNPDRPFSLNDASHLIGPGGITQDEYRDGYIGQLEFVNDMVLRAVTTILTESVVSPIIIVQGDHGPGSMHNHSSVERSHVGERLTILNAYHLPAGGNDLVYADITPVNTFRLILAHYFGASVDMLPDRSYYSPWDRPYAITDVTGRVLAETAWE